MQQDDILKIVLTLIAVGASLTFIAILFESPNAGNVLSSSAGAFRTTFSTFLPNSGSR